MHDPMTVAFEIKYPWVATRRVRKDGTVWKYRRPIVTIWHRDPEKDGSDDSCDWFGNRRKLNMREKALATALSDLLHVLGNAPFYPDGRIYGSDPHSDDPSRWGPIGHVRQAMWQWRRRHFRLHPRYHIWHWRIQVHPLQQLRRWLFVRCGYCGDRFGWNESPVRYSWSGEGPRFHSRCTDEYERAKATLMVQAN